MISKAICLLIESSWAHSKDKARDMLYHQYSFKSLIQQSAIEGVGDGSDGDVGGIPETTRTNLNSQLKELRSCQWFLYLIYSSPVPAPDVSDLQGFWEWYNIFIYVVRLEITSYFIYEKDKDILHSV